jgi:hypothetical protein
MIEAFMWGYWGWGGSTNELVEAFDAAEAQRGYEPPVFVDVRIRREVRAVGFRGDAFEKLLGKGRYVWLQDLGNEGVLDHGPLRLRDPRVTNDLLDIIVEKDRERRRVLFYCACETPRTNGALSCHRDYIAELLTNDARQRRIVLSVSEWPGGVPRRLIARFPAAAVRAAQSETANGVPMPKEISPAIGVSLPWGSYAVAEGPDSLVPLVVGPAIHRQGQWSLQRRLATPGGSNEAQWQRTILACRKAWGYEPRLSPASARAPEPSWEELVVGG